MTVRILEHQKKEQPLMLIDFERGSSHAALISNSLSKPLVEEIVLSPIASKDNLAGYVLFLGFALVMLAGAYKYLKNLKQEQIDSNQGEFEKFKIGIYASLAVETTKKAADCLGACAASVENVSSKNYETSAEEKPSKVKCIDKLYLWMTFFIEKIFCLLGCPSSKKKSTTSL